MRLRVLDPRSRTVTSVNVPSTILVLGRKVPISGIHGVPLNPCLWRCFSRGRSGLWYLIAQITESPLPSRCNETTGCCRRGCEMHSRHVGVVFQVKYGFVVPQGEQEACFGTNLLIINNLAVRVGFEPTRPSRNLQVTDSSLPGVPGVPSLPSRTTPKLPKRTKPHACLTPRPRRGSCSTLL